MSCLEARRNCRELPGREIEYRTGGMYLAVLLFPFEGFSIWMLKEVVINGGHLQERHCFSLVGWAEELPTAFV
jgi:hypothetical protein